MKTNVRPFLNIKHDAAHRAHFIGNSRQTKFYQLAFDWCTAHLQPRVIVWHDGEKSSVEWDCCTAEGKRDLLVLIRDDSDSFMDMLKDTLFDMLGHDELHLIGSAFSGEVKDLDRATAEQLGADLPVMLESLIQWALEREGVTEPD